MDDFTNKLNILKRYYKDMTSTYPFYIKDEMPSKKLTVAINSFAQGVDRSKIIGFCDITIFNTGKKGYIFTDTAVYWLEAFSCPKKLCYSDIVSVKYYESRVDFNISDGNTISWDSSFNLKPLYDFFDELLKVHDVKSAPLETSDISDRIGKIEMLFTDPVYEGKKRGYDRAAREYRIAYLKMEDKYNKALEELSSKRNEYDSRTDRFISHLKELENQKAELKILISKKQVEISKQKNVSISDIKKYTSAISTLQKCEASYSGFDTSLLCLIYKSKEKKMIQAEHDGYIEARSVHNEKLEILKENFKKEINKLNANIKELGETILEVLDEISKIQMEIADLKLLL